MFGWCRLLTRRNSWLRTSSQLWLQVSRCYEGQPPPQLITLHGCRACRSNKETPKKVIAVFLNYSGHDMMLSKMLRFQVKTTCYSTTSDIPMAPGRRPAARHWTYPETRWVQVACASMEDALYGCKMAESYNDYMMLTHCWRHPALGELMTQPQPHRIVRSLVWSFLCWHNAGIFGYSLASCSAPC